MGAPAAIACRREPIEARPPLLSQNPRGLPLRLDRQAINFHDSETVPSLWKV